VTDEELLAELIDSSPTFAADWRSTEEYYPLSDPQTIRDVLFQVVPHILRFLMKDRRNELTPLLAAVERIYVAGTPTQREHVRYFLLNTVAHVCRDGGVDPELFVAHLGPVCKAAWIDIDLE